MNDLLPTQKINTVATYGHSNTKKWLRYTNKLMVIIFVGGQLNECKSTPATSDVHASFRNDMSHSLQPKNRLLNTQSFRNNTWPL